MERFFLFSVICFLLLEDNIALPTTQMVEDPELTGGFTEGDMILPAQLRNGMRSQIYRWPDRKVFYHIGGNIDRKHREYIKTAMAIIELNSCLSFEEVTADQSYYVNITSDPGGCYSAVGYQEKVQQMNLENYALDEGCYRMGSVLHELLHVLGFQHQQSTWNRDEYVRIAFENIADGKEHNFEKYDENIVDNFDQDYDYGSVMHYTPYGFSKNGEMTIVPLKSGAEKLMGQRLQLSTTDINKLNIMYKCPINI